MQPQKAPGPGTLSFFRELGSFRRDPLGGFFRYALRFGDVVRYRGLWTTHQITHPEGILQVLQTNAGNYRKGRDYRILRLSLGQGLLTSEGALWQRQRSMTQPAFQSQQIAAFVRVMEEQTQRLLERWETFARAGQIFDAVPELMRLTLNIASQALFTTDLEQEMAAIQQSLEVGRDYSVERAWSVIRIPRRLPTPRNLRHRRSLEAFHAVVDRMIAKRRRASERIPDLLTTLMEASTSDRQLRDEVATLLTAGHETTTLALAWALFLLAQHPDAVERVAAEISFLNGRAPAYEDLARLKYTRNVAEETMRLFPPVWVISRTAIGEDLIGGFRIPAGSEILIFPYITHRHPKWWQEPEKFAPERFSAENAAARVRGAYLPFGAGPRICVGLNFAMTEVLVALTMLLQRFRPELAVDAREIRMEPSVTLRPSPGIPIKLRRP
jgi:cytochrome P450